MSTDRRRDDRRKNEKDVSDERREDDRRNENRRESERTPLDLWVEEEQGDELYFRRTGNVSSGGLFFEQTIPHAIGTKLSIRFTLPGDSTVIEAVGEVVNTPSESDALGMGLKFVEISDDHRKRIDDYIAAHGKDD